MDYIFDYKLNILGFWSYLSKKRKKQLFGIIVLSLISGLSELLTISSILPFLAVISSPNTLSNYQISIFLSNLLSIPLNEEIYFYIVVFFVISIIFSTFLRLLNIRMSLKIAALIGTDLNVKIFSNVIYQEYSYHINTNSSEIIAANTEYIGRAVRGITSALNLVSNAILSILIFIGIIFINPKLTFILISILSLIYFFIGKNLNKRITTNSKKIVLASSKKIKLIQESLGSIRSILLESNQKPYSNQIKDFDRIIRDNSAKNEFIAEFPRYAIECIILVLIAFVCLLTFKNKNIDNSTILVLLGSFALGLQRLLPNIQRVYSSWANLRASTGDIEYVLKILGLLTINKSKRKSEPILFKKSIKLDSIYFNYNDKGQNIISNLNFEIFKGQKIGIIGKTGSGKTTTADLIMGLLKPSLGKIYVDGKDIHDGDYPERIQRWMKTISHVPQNIFLTDGTIKENIAFGIKDNLISLSKVKEAAKKAQIHEFIESSENGYSTVIGERGIKLSGGQRQRIGIARALYKESEIIIFDEATSALDNKTELSLMKCIDNISKNITIISIAHRHSTLKNCDKIISIENGSIISVHEAKDIL